MTLSGWPFRAASFCSRSLFCGWPSGPEPLPDPKETPMTLPLTLAALTALGLLAYLVVALMRPEKF
ncbi:hypothetical protein NUTIK01_03590 [Novosphingobium sp. IK01]|uniref:K(+)-transporting ATPase subunit F n=1 Tax=Novosphingobium pituita TaxID=3056842 RepID=A0ABQ6P2W2_9SPHN|nr:hypothetical protein NUTIK01_03590 [Novosphingobium sp. IK01]